VTEAGSASLTLDDLEAFVATVEQLSYVETSRPVFFSQLVEGLRRRLSFPQVLVTLFSSDGKILLAGGSSSHFPVPDQSLMTPGESRYDRHNGNERISWFALDHCFHAGEILRIEAQAEEELPLTNPALQDLLGTCAVLAGNFLIRHAERKLHAQLEDRQRIDAMISQLAQAENRLQPDGDLCRILQNTLNVDRVSLLWTTPHSAQLTGTSASPEIVRNSTAVRLLEQITLAMGRRGDKFEIIIGGPPALAAPPLRKEIDEYVEETSVRQLRWIPVHEDELEPHSPIGFLLLEHFSADWPDDRQQQILELAEPHAVQSAKRVLSAAHNSPWFRLRTAFAKRGLWYGGWAGALALLMLLLLIIPADLEIPVDGVLLPARRAAVFAPVQGIVDQISVQHGASISRGEPLMVLRAPELEIEERRISGEIATLRSRLDSLKTARIRNRVTGSRSGNETDLSAEESDLEAQFKGLTAQLALIHKQSEFLIVKAPFNGRVDRWDLNQALADRPVTHGQYLCDVLDIDGDWTIELNIPDDVAGYVLNAQSRKPCPVSYLFRTASDRTYQSHLENISNSVQLDHDGQPVVQSRMPADTDGKSQFRVGAGVLARIHCGKRSLGFVYLREVIEFIRRNTWF